MPEKTPQPLPSRPPPWPEPVPTDPEQLPPLAADPAPWWPCPWYDPAPPWWGKLEVIDQAKLVAGRLAYKRAELKAKLAYIDVLTETLK